MNKSAQLILILVMAFLFRLWSVHYYGSAPSSDAADYHDLAVSIASGDGFSQKGHPTSFRPPLFPAFVACVYKLTGPNWKLAEYADAILGVLTVWLVFLVARKNFGNSAALISAAIAAVFPSFIWISRILLSENLAIPLLLGAILFFPRWPSGIALGLALLCRPSTIFFVAVLFFWLMLSKRWTRLFVLSTMIAICLIPWSVRNYLVQKAFVPVATDGGITLYASYWPPQKNGKTIWGMIADRKLSGNEVEVSREYVRLVAQGISQDPLLPLRLAPAKVFWLLAPVEWEYFPRPRSINWGYILILIPGVIGAWKSRDPLLWSIPIAVVLQSLVFFGAARYRLPAEAILVIWAGPVIQNWFSRARFLSAQVPDGPVSSLR